MINICSGVVSCLIFMMGFLYVFYNILISKKEAVKLLGVSLFTLIPYYLYIQFQGLFQKEIYELTAIICFTLIGSTIIIKILVKKIIIVSLVTGLFEVATTILAYLILQRFNIRIGNYDSEFVVVVELFLKAMIIFLMISLGVYYKLFQKIQVDVKKLEIRGFLYNFILIVFICGENIYFWINAENLKMQYEVLFINVLLLIIFIIISVKNLHTYVRLSETSAQIEIQTTYNETMQSFMDEVKRIKHSYHNMLMPLSGYIKLKKWDTIKRYLSEVSADFETADSLKTLISLNIKNAAILGLLNSKMKLAGNNGVSFIIKSSTEVNSINSKMYILNDILGELIDYSIKCSKNSKQKYLDFEIKNENNHVVFNIKNSCADNFNHKTIYDKQAELSIWSINDKVNRQKKLSLDTNFENGMLNMSLRIRSNQ